MFEFQLIFATNLKHCNNQIENTNEKAESLIQANTSILTQITIS